MKRHILIMMTSFVLATSGTGCVDSSIIHESKDDEWFERHVDYQPARSEIQPDFTAEESALEGE